VVVSVRVTSAAEQYVFSCDHIEQASLIEH